MNKGDLVYVYLFDIKKTIINMKEFRKERFGVIIDRQIGEIQGTNGRDHQMIYKIRNCKNSIIEYQSNSLAYSMISVAELIEVVDSLEIDRELKRALLDQINKAIAMFK